jgi:hypothetical protein
MTSAFGRHCAMSGLSPLLNGISFLTFNSNWFATSKGFPLQGFTPSWATAFPAAPEGTGFASGEHVTPRNDRFRGRVRRHFSRQTCAVIENCSTLRSPYPAGDGSIAIFASMPANSRRVR